jgi:glycosyltransferase involved in cell wall biosynthesis
MPKYTVVMPARDAASTITLAIQSVLAHFPKDTQVVVWDDGSTDETAVLASCVDPKRVVVHSHTESQGGGVARQRIIDLTDSEYLVNQDADDISLPWRFKVQKKLLEDSDFAFTAVRRFSDQRPIHRPSLPLSYTPAEVPIALLFHNPLSHPTMIAKRSALEDVGGYSDAPVAQDYELWLRAAAKGKRIRRSAIPSLSYRISENQVSQQKDYANRVIKSMRLVESYADLLEHLTHRAWSREALNTSKDGVGIPTVSEEILENLLQQVRLPLHAYYKYLMHTQRYGHIGAMAIGI